MEKMATLKDARRYIMALPQNLDEYLDEICPPQESDKYSEFTEWNKQA